MSGSEQSGYEPPAALVGAIRDSGLIGTGSSGVVLLSGGPDSISLLAGLAGAGLGDLVALHLNYGLREESAADQAICEAACEKLGVELLVENAGSVEGNLQNWAREVRYEAAERLRHERGADWIAVGHTISDVAETVIYRLASSPGRRALTAMKPASGAVVRPLINLTRAETRSLAVETGIEFADDASNRDPAFARVRIRSEVLPVLEDINPAAAANVALTRAELIEEADLLDGLAADLADRLLDGGHQLRANALAAEHPALRRLVVRELVLRQTGAALPVPFDLAAEAMRLAGDPEGGRLDLGSGHRLLIEAGTISVESVEAGNELGEVSVVAGPGTAWGDWEVSLEPLESPFTPVGPAVATLDSSGLETTISVRGWQDGDRIQPLGMEGSKSLQDLFTDAGVPRSERRRIPVFVSGGEIVWVAGLAIADRHRLRPETGAAVRLHAVKTKHA
ncbi:MAG: tRNA lysidine(34) synthetase TilS [Solirubrobacterales bacterium]